MPGYRKLSGDEDEWAGRVRYSSTSTRQTLAKGVWMFTMMRIPLPEPSARTPESRQGVLRGGAATAALLVLIAVLVLAPAVTVRAEFANPQGVAIIVGNQAYEHRDVPEVGFAHRDAEAFRRYVVDVLGFDPKNIIDLRDTTRRELFDALGTRTNPRGVVWSYLDPDGGSDVVVYYSGHGVPDVNDKKGYLLPVDADPNAAQDDGYPINLLYKNLGGLAEASSVQVYLDACFSGGSHEGVLIKNARPAFIAAKLPDGVGGKVVSLTAASGEQVASWDTEAEHGLFTLHLLDALYGGGDEDGDGRVTAVEAKRYLDRHMTRAARRQYRRVQVASLIGAQDMVLAAAPADGAFPDRRAPGAPHPVPDRTVDEGGGDAAVPAFDVAAVTGGNAILTVETTPPGVSVLVGGVKVGETPLHHYDLRAGTYTVTLEHPTHETVVLEEQRLADNEVLRIERELARATGKVTVITQPVGAWIEQEGERLAQTTPVTLDGLPSGLMVLKLGAEGHGTVEVEVEVPKGGVARVERELEELRYGTLTLELSPPEAQARLLDVAEDYRSGMSLPPGTYRVRVSAEGWVAQETTLRHGTEPTRHEVTLEPERNPAADEAGLDLSRSDGKLVQQGLTVAGFSPGPADGKFGRRTREAISEWQSSRGEPATGYLDASSAALLLEAGEAASPPEPKRTFGPKCVELPGQYLSEDQAECWQEFEDQPGCHWWTDHYHSDRTARWTGRCDGGLAVGGGTLSLSAGSKHSSYEGTGTFTGGKLSGRWIEEWADGERYEGEFRDGKRTGRGTFTWADGARYEGQWRDGKRTGRGTFTWADGARYEGDYRDGKWHGRGTFTRADGERYEGGWRDGKPHGHGTLTKVNGKRYEGEWREGCFGERDGKWWAVFTTAAKCGFK